MSLFPLSSLRKKSIKDTVTTSVHCTVLTGTTSVFYIKYNESYYILSLECWREIRNLTDDSKLAFIPRTFNLVLSVVKPEIKCYAAINPQEEEWNCLG